MLRCTIYVDLDCAGEGEALRRGECMVQEGQMLYSGDAGWYARCAGGDGLSNESWRTVSSFIYPLDPADP